MKRKRIIPGFVLALALLSVIYPGSLQSVAPAAAIAPNFEGSFAPVEQFKILQAGQDVQRCATIDNAPAGIKRHPNQDELPFYQMRAVAFATNSATPKTVQVAFHVIQSSTGEGEVTDAQIARQIAVMNRAYHDAGFRFELASVDRTVNDKWFNVVVGTGGERKIKQALAIDPTHTLNIYTAALLNKILGWAYYPWAFEETSWEHAVFLHYKSLPGGAYINYNEGDTATHEVGHYMGLYHTFQGGCEEPGDYVADTQAEATWAIGCPVGRDTCPAPGLDPIENFMDYTDDPCMNEFTAGQAARMIWAVETYRPSLIQ